VRLADAPVWLSGLLMAVAFLIAMEIGYRLHLRVMGGREDRDRSEGAGHVVTAALGLLALLIAFTFEMSSQRYELRRQLVVEEANAITVNYLRDQLFDEPARGQLSAVMVDYAKDRADFGDQGVDTKTLDAADARDAVFQQRIWQETALALRARAAAPLTTSVLEATNSMIDAAASRRAALEARVPERVFAELVLYAFATAVIMGYTLAVGRRRHRVASTVLFILVALAISLIADLDQPRTGAIIVSQAPIQRAVAAIVAAEAAKPHPPR
jgi:hypothetical protein